MFDVERIYRVGALLLDCACQKLALTIGGCPPRMCLVPGATPEVVNCCAHGGQLTVNVVRSYPSRTFPNPDLGEPSNCDVPYLVVNYSVQVWRCSPVGNVERAPSCDSLDDAARKTMADMTAITQGIICCLRDEPTHESIIGPGYRWALGDATMEGPEGMCTGVNLQVIVGLPTCWEC